MSSLRLIETLDFTLLDIPSLFSTDLQGRPVLTRLGGQALFPPVSALFPPPPKTAVPMREVPTPLSARHALLDSSRAKPPPFLRLTKVVTFVFS